MRKNLFYGEFWWFVCVYVGNFYCRSIFRCWWWFNGMVMMNVNVFGWVYGLVKLKKCCNKLVIFNIIKKEVELDNKIWYME